MAAAFDLVTMVVMGEKVFYAFLFKKKKKLISFDHSTICLACFKKKGLDVHAQAKPIISLMTSTP